MVKELVVYPDERIKITSADVRTFDEKLFTLIENMRDTMDANGLDGLAAIQIAVPATVVLVRFEGTLYELVNPRIIGSEGTVESTETTAYWPGISATPTRYGKIKLIYQDRHGAQHSMDVDGELSRIIQRKVDYTFGGTFADKLDKKGRKRVEREAETAYGAAARTCEVPASGRSVLLRVINGIIWFLLLALFVPLFSDGKEWLESLARFAMAAGVANLVLIVGYFLYAQYEARTNRVCTSCQTGNIIGTALIALAKTVGLLLLAYFILFPDR